MILIRKAVHSDLEKLVQLIGDLFSMEPDFIVAPEKQLKGLQMILDTPGAAILVAVDNDNVIGMVSCQMTISTAEGGYSGLVEDMVIENDYRGKGIGTLLIQKIVEWCMSNGASRVQLLADKNNSDALLFYKKNKWSQTNMICLRAEKK